mmetsp:Transcript_15872/g.39147  ORF Transcript_15872/g.39147 Transcript_15872/m.39147 type:complete len:352 (+) Transcript_15872:164-1219(+)
MPWLNPDNIQSYLTKPRTRIYAEGIKFAIKSIVTFSFPGSPSSSTIASAPEKSSSPVYPLFVTTTVIPADLPAHLPMCESSMTAQRSGGTPSFSLASIYTAGSGFFFGTMSPAKIVNWLALSEGRRSTTAATDFSFEVEQHATLTPREMASDTRRSTPGLNASSPELIILLNMSVLRRWISFTFALLWVSSSGQFAGQPTWLKYAVILSFPPPTSRSLPYSSTPHSKPKPIFSNARLKATLCPSFSVSTRTPSQSNKRASGICALEGFRRRLADAAEGKPGVHGRPPAVLMNGPWRCPTRGRPTGLAGADLPPTTKDSATAPARRTEKKKRRECEMAEGCALSMVVVGMFW